MQKWTTVCCLLVEGNEPFAQKMYPSQEKVNIYPNALISSGAELFKSIFFKEYECLDILSLNGTLAAKWDLLPKASWLIRGKTVLEEKHSLMWLACE